jgi:diacylglycerol kinase
LKKNKKFSIKDRIRSFKFAFEGLAHFFKTEHNAWIHIVATAVVITLGLVFNVSTHEWLWLSLAIALVFISEIFNSAIERSVDLSTTEINPLAKQAKDLSAGATLVAAIFALIVGLTVFIPHLVDYFGR